MTPEEARVVQDARLSAGWDWCPDDMHDSLEEDMSATIAALQWEYGVEQDNVHCAHFEHGADPTRCRYTTWLSDEDTARLAADMPFRTDRHPRLVRRPVGPVEVVEVVEASVRTVEGHN
ncbi:hypothetical protein [Corynebacterium kalidii]|uniref:Uncharacterized protein n=1 Tax=Corynebacterium kalidii TaxID=2931982 RepID=A0A9X1WKK1_9CORY|nr:hypothetical protein [Corynebacterium kalidii]MCJ7859252.1 hypothetical protein [Corynebacterium kalidii]